MSDESNKVCAYCMKPFAWEDWRVFCQSCAEHLDEVRRQENERERMVRRCNRNLFEGIAGEC